MRKKTLPPISENRSQNFCSPRHAPPPPPQIHACGCVTLYLRFTNLENGYTPQGVRKTLIHYISGWSVTAGG